ncbi:MAG: hypothetical protein J6T10_17405 [Methanobrevibacter sp.]|nr:hypothetical protein [Methanobrevibacter sp.]
MAENIDFNALDNDMLDKYAHYCLDLIKFNKDNSYNLNIDKLTKSGNLYFRCSLGYMHRYSCYLNLYTGKLNVFNTACQIVRFNGIPPTATDYFKFIDNMQEAINKIPVGILKIPKNLGV